MEAILREWITRDQFSEFTRPLVGLPVSWAWLGYGSTIFLEFGTLIAEEKLRKDGSIRVSYRGEMTAMIEVGWRVERPRSIAFGSDSGKRKIENGLFKLHERQVAEVTVEGRLPEIVFELSGGCWVHSFVNWGGQPDWCLFFNKQRYWIAPRRGKLELTFDS